MAISPEHQTGAGTSSPAHIKQEQVDAPALSLPRGTKRSADVLQESGQDPEGRYDSVNTAELPAEAGGPQAKLAEVEKARKNADAQVRYLLVKRAKHVVAAKEIEQRYVKDHAWAEGELLRIDERIAAKQADCDRLAVEVQDAVAAVQAESQQQRRQFEARVQKWDDAMVAKMAKVDDDKLARMFDAMEG
ncbi:hypothetical protein B0A48_13605 [Cryoendolithus antarcticus]|uniref:Uncharacterized protein n=1 Tax=Cryoendolithus antarcticus TaxID=1507870 RepID=A0A1V8SP21_9PEZI|nr:hypothetical protein B0A48_13605 [Cryoendolithus antarcticus]